MNTKDLLKKYWFIGLVAIGLIVYFVVYAVQSYQNKPVYVDAKNDADGNSIVYTIEDKNLLADEFYETLYNDLGAYTAYSKWSRAVIDKAVKTTEEINNYASNYANYIAAYNDQDTIDSSLKQYGYSGGYDDLLQYCVDMVKADYLYRDYYVANFDTYARNVIEDYSPKKVYHILIKVENVEDTTDENDNSVKVANMTAEEQAKLDAVVEALKTQSYETVCATYSDEDSTKDNGGYLGIYDDQTVANQMVKEFSDAVIALQYGEVSEPVLSEYGYHIIKVVKPTDDELKEDKNFMSEISSYYTYSNIVALKEKADELGFEIKDEKLANLIDEYVEGAASEINPETEVDDIVESEDEE